MKLLTVGFKTDNTYFSMFVLWVDFTAIVLGLESVYSNKQILLICRNREIEESS